MRVGEVQYFFKHRVVFEGEPLAEEHAFARVYWKKLHPRGDWFGASATICTDLYELSELTTFLPVQRIASRCAHATLTVDFGSHQQNVFVACPIPVKYCI